MDQEIKIEEDEISEITIVKEEQPEDSISFSFESPETSTTTHFEDETQNFACDYCKKTFLAEHALTTHLRKFKYTKNDCEICQEKLCTVMQLKRHKEEVHNKKCDICSKRFRTSPLLFSHMKSEHKGSELPELQCPKCDYSCKHRYNLRRHMLKHKDEEGSLFICNICHNVSKNRFSLHSHILYAHKMEEKHKCSFCNLKFKRKYELKLHLPIHESKNLLECPECQGAFKLLSNLNIHRKKYHPKEFEEDETNRFKNYTLIPVENEDPVYQCNICNKILQTLRSLKEHSAQHTGIPLYTCSFCPMAFNTLATVYRHHKLLHPKESEAAMIRGEKIESIKPKEENFECVCKKCGLIVDDFSALIAHTKEVHPEAGVHDCKFCEKTFLKRHNLIKHMATHNEETICDCSHCTFKCSTPKELNDHIKEMHPNEYLASFGKSLKDGNKPIAWMDGFDPSIISSRPFTIRRTHVLVKSEVP